jgi:hypothetical protein
VGHPVGFAYSPASQLLTALSGASGQQIDIDDQDECVLSFEGQIDVVLAQAPGTQVLSLRSALTPPGWPIGPALMRGALALNYTSMPAGCAIALEDTASQLVLLALVDAERTLPDALLSLLAEFVEIVPRLRETFEAAQGAVDPPMVGTGVTS